MSKKLNMIALMILLIGQVILGPIGSLSAYATYDPPEVAPDQVAETDIAVVDEAETVTTLVSESEEKTTDVDIDIDEPEADQAVEPQSEEAAEVDEAPPSDEGEEEEEAAFSLMSVADTQSEDRELFGGGAVLTVKKTFEGSEFKNPLLKAKFKLTGPRGYNSGEVTISDDGTYVFPKMTKDGEYTLTELDPVPAGYKKAEPWKFKIDDGEFDEYGDKSTYTETIENKKIPSANCEAEEAGPGRSDCRHVYVTKIDTKGKPIEDITFYTSRNNDKWGREGDTGPDGKVTLEFAHNGNTFLTEANGDYKLCSVLEDGNKKKNIIEHKRKGMEEYESGVVFQDNKDKHYTFINAPTGTDCDDDGNGKITIKKTFTDVSTKPFPEVTFKLFKDGVDTGKTATTHKDTGVAIFTDLDFGEYYVEEVDSDDYVATYDKGNEANPVKIGRDNRGKVVQKFTINVKNTKVHLGTVILTKQNDKKDSKGNYIKLEGAEFDLYDLSTEPPTKVNTEVLVTNASGQIVVPNLKPGNYKFVEVKAPEYYKFNNKARDLEFTIKNEKNFKKSVTVKNTLTYGSVKLIKVKEGTDTRLDDAVFDLYKKNGISPIRTGLETGKENGLETSELGVIKVVNLEPGEYYFKETAPPEGYEEKTGKIEFTVTKGKTTVKTVENTPKPGSLEITKVWIDASATENFLADAKFTLTDGTNYYDVDGKVIAQDDDSNIVTVAGGKVTVKNLKPGIYTLQEIEAPYGYQLKTVAEQVNIESGKTTETKVTNDLILGTVTLTKTDKDTGAKLEKVVFELHKKGINGAADTEIDLGENNKTGANGTLTVTDLEYGDYYFEEITPKEGYKDANGEQLDFFIGEHGVTVPISVTNEAKLGSLEIFKYWLDGDDRKELPEAEFTLMKGDLYYNNAGEPSADEFILESDDNGFINVINLEQGVYTLTEVNAPEGFRIIDSENERIKELTIGPGAAIELEVENERITGSIALTKRDSQTEELLKGVVFDLYKVGEVNPIPIGDYTTDEDGMFTAENLPVGDYYFEEEEHLPDYEANDEKYYFTVENDGTVTVMVEGESQQTDSINVYNTALPGSLVVEKTWTETREVGTLTGPLAGAKFTLTLHGVYYNYDGTPSDDEVILETDNDGKITVENLKQGEDYVLEEVGAPYGYEIREGEGIYPITIVRNKEITQPVDNERITGSIMLYKFDNADPEGNGLNEATFAIFEAGKPDAPYRSNLVTSDADGYGDGYLLVENLPVGEYYFIETEPRPGYLPNGTPYPFEIDEDGNAIGELLVDGQIAVGNDLIPAIEGSVLLYKKDSVTGKALDEVIFSLFKDGEVYLEGLTTGETGPGAGYIQVDHLPAGTYYFVETQALDGYYDNNNHYEFIIGGGSSPVEDDEPEGEPSDNSSEEPGDNSSEEPSDNSSEEPGDNSSEESSDDPSSDSNVKLNVGSEDDDKALFEVEEEQEEQGENQYQDEESEGNQESDDIPVPQKPILIPVENVAKTGTIVLNKTTNNGTPLDGAVFSLFRVGEAVAIKTGLTTGGEGQAVGELIVNNLRFGDYYFEETQAPSDYQIDRTPHPFTIGDDTMEQEPITVTNSRIPIPEPETGSVTLFKQDSVTGAALDGAEFALFRVGEDDAYLTGTTTNGGILEFGNLPVGNYYFVEMKEPTGYVLDQTQHPFTITGNQTASVPVLVLNVPITEPALGSVTLFKQDSVTGLALDGAEFALFRVGTDEAYQIGTTVSGGILEIENLPIGNYYFVETEAPTGYVLDQTPHSFEITGNETASVPISVLNVPVIEPALGSVTLFKVDSVTNAALNGATFDLYREGESSAFASGVTTGGMLEIGNLSAGNYYFVETAAPSGYVLDSTPHPFTIIADQTASVPLTVSNVAVPEPEPGSVILYKIDSVTGVSLTGAAFDLYREGESSAFRSGVTVGGMLEIGELLAGNYYFVETAAPAGYVLDSTPRPFTITANQTAGVEVTVTNVADPGPGPGPDPDPGPGPTPVPPTPQPEIPSVVVPPAPGVPVTVEEEPQPEGPIVIEEEPQPEGPSVTVEEEPQPEGPSVTVEEEPQPEGPSVTVVEQPRPEAPRPTLPRTGEGVPVGVLVAGLTLTLLGGWLLFGRRREDSQQ